MDNDKHPVPIGVAGELYIGGDGLARGYLNRPGLTAEKFIPNPFSTVAGARMYRSGDLARYLPDGNIEYLGRIDQQVKIRGFRIELGEIEAALVALPGIGDALVLAREDQPGDKRLVAYVVMHEAAGFDDTALRTALSLTLPDYMVPAHFVMLDSLPLTPNGKIDRKALPAPDMTRGDSGYMAPRTPTEDILAGIWSDVLKLDRVGVYDNFFNLGGHSLLAVTLIARMRSAGLQVDVRALFATPTIAALAAVVTATGRAIEVPSNLIPIGCTSIAPEMLPLVRLDAEQIANIVGLVPGGGANVQDIYPLAPLQEGILFHHLMSREGDPYLLSTLVALDTRERLGRFIDALQVVIARHDILRSAVFWDGLSEPVQVVLRQAPMVIEEVELDPGETDVAAQLSTLYSPRHYRLDVRQAPLLRGFAAHDPVNERWVLQILMHHLVSDHTTLELLLEEIQIILKGQKEQLPTALPYRNFVAQARLGVSQAEHEAFFTRMLRDIDEPTAPFGLLDVQGDGSDIEEASLVVEAGLARSIRAKARALGVTPASLMHLAWGQVLSKISGRRDVVFGTVLFGRMDSGAGAERVVGMFINTLPICLRMDERGVAQAVRDTHVLLTELLCHEHASLALAQRCSGIAAPTPLFASLLNYRY
ncbi:condensation domain-containing protein, partial [Collimonas pratensis]|uniref:condensation domain-containing protein n=1 Tax=Collimonas pratensis TaxID=279113 RepID=UPI0023F914B7